jgi:hypothetical protein
MILLLMAGSYLILWSATRNKSQNETCTESMEDCCKKKTDKNTSDGKVWETCSHQFISTTIGF